MSLRSGVSLCRLTYKMESWLCLRTASSQWATTATSALTAVTGALYRRRTSSAGPCSFTGHLRLLATSTPGPASVTGCNSFSPSCFISWIGHAGHGCSTWCTDARPDLSANDVDVGPACIDCAGRVAAALRQCQSLPQPRHGIDWTCPGARGRRLQYCAATSATSRPGARKFCRRGRPRLRFGTHASSRHGYCAASDELAVAGASGDRHVGAR